MQALLTTLSPRAAMKDYVIQPNEIFVLVLEGKVRTEFADGRELVLEAGDSAAFISGEQGHRHENLSDGTSRLVVVIRRTRPR